MPKTKTHSGLKKRIKKSGTGKLICFKHVGMRHNLSNNKKTKKQKRHLGQQWQISKADERRVRVLLS